MTGGWYTTDSTRERRGGGGGGGGRGGVGAGGGVGDGPGDGGARRHDAEEAHSLQAPLVEEPEKVSVVEAPDDARTPAWARRSVHVVAGPCVARVEALEPHVARRGAPGGYGGRMWRGKGHR
jgi:hypothetical protein